MTTVSLHVFERESDTRTYSEPRFSSIGREDALEAAEELTIVIPAFNEELGIGYTLLRLQAEGRLAGAQLIVVSDGSTDRTAEIAAEHGATVIENWTNLGYGASLKRGIEHAQTALVAWFDADGQHDPAALAAMVDRLTHEKAQAVFGVRAADSHVVHQRVLGKRLIKFVAESAMGRSIPDVNCGLRVFRRVPLLRYLNLLPNGFSASTTSTLLFMNRNHHILFQKVRTAERIGTSSVRHFRDGFRTLHTIVRITVMFNAFRTFSAAAAALIGAGLIYGVALTLINGNGFPVFAAMTTILGVQVFCLGVVCDQISAMRLEHLDSKTSDTDHHSERRHASRKAA